VRPVAFSKTSWHLRTPSKVPHPPLPTPFLPLNKAFFIDRLNAEPSTKLAHSFPQQKRIDQNDVFQKLTTIPLNALKGRPPMLRARNRMRLAATDTFVVVDRERRHCGIGAAHCLENVTRTSAWSVAKNVAVVPLAFDCGGQN
jgi:hypothetical protein